MLLASTETKARELKAQGMRLPKLALWRAVLDLVEKFDMISFCKCGAHAASPRGPMT